MTIRLIAIDLDGTLIHDGDHLPPENLAAIRAAQARGVTVAVFTGRPYGSAAAVVERLGLGETPIVAYNGAVIRMPDFGEVLREAYVSSDLAREVVALGVERRLQVHYYVWLDDRRAEAMYVPKVTKCSRVYQQRTGVPPVPVGDLRRLDGQTPIKLLICEEPETIEHLLPELQGRYEGRLYITRSMPEYLEFLNLEASKGRALEWLAARMGIPMAETMGIGDQHNDLPLIECAGVGVAMLRADEALKVAADWVATESETGVAEAIERFVLGLA